VTFSPFRSETIAVVSAPGAQGAEVRGYPGLKLDGQGNAVVPYLRPYEFNDVGVDPRGASQDLEITESNRKVVPTAGAVLAIDFVTTQGRALLLNVHLADGRPLPFGSNVSLAAGQPLGMVGQGGQLYARVPEGADQLQVSWGPEVNQTCVLKVPNLDGDRQDLKLQDSVCTLGPH
jgi:outer membrane usher protein